MLDRPEAFHRRQIVIEQLSRDANLAACREELIAVMSRLQSQALDDEAIRLIENINRKIAERIPHDNPRPPRRKPKGRRP